MKKKNNLDQKECRNPGTNFNKGTLPIKLTSLVQWRRLKIKLVYNMIEEIKIANHKV